MCSIDCAAIKTAAGCPAGVSNLAQPNCESIMPELALSPPGFIFLIVATSVTAASY
jgi:hypothetical protein